MAIYLTSESVTEGHPDKVCDQLSDAILDAHLAQDPHARVAVETLATTGLVFVAGEVTSTATVDVQHIVRATLRRIGYTDARHGIDADTCAVLVALDAQSPDIAQGVDHSDDHEQGAGDQGMMYGYATDETPQCLPLPITLAHALTRRLAQVRRDGLLDYLGPDGKAQVTIAYDGDTPLYASAVVVSAQHAEHVDIATVRRDLLEHVVLPVCGSWLTDETNIHLNPTGRFVVGGPHGDTGLTGRKIIVDTYGGIGRHGGGAFSGKDPSKVDRSGAYVARWIAKAIVAAKLAHRCEVQVSYAIGVARPTSVHIDTFGTGTRPDEELACLVQERVDLRPRAIIKRLGLQQPIYLRTASYGHFGREEFPWEDVDELAQALIASVLAV